VKKKLAQEVQGGATCILWDLENVTRRLYDNREFNIGRTFWEIVIDIGAFLGNQVPNYRSAIMP